MAAGDTFELIRPTDRFVFDSAGNLTGIRNPRANGADLHSRSFGSFAFADLPAAASYNGYEAFASDWGANGTRVRSNGTRWLPVNGQTILKHLGAQVTGIANTAAIVIQTLLPVNALQANDCLWFDFTGLAKSGATDNLILTCNMGTAGTVSDTAVVSLTNMTGAQQTASSIYAVKVASTTSVQRVGPNAASGLYGAVNANAAPAAVTGLSDFSANAIYLSMTIRSSSTTDTVGIQDGKIIHIAG